MISNYKLVDGFQNLLDKEHWDIYCSLTFRTRTLFEEAMKEFKHFFKHLNKSGEVFFPKYILSWVFYEKGDVRGGVHLHSLIKGINPSLASNLQNKCNDFFGDSQVVSYNHNLPREKLPSRYLAKKYISNELDFFDIYKINSKLRR
ncbi:MAG: hypothetical protein NT014_00980 [Candidatus Omnitrophica bacterium]|nr:hypothetical protein [Candidatus Omnitrophota bacterium]